MNFYQILTLVIVAILPFFPRQLDPKIVYLIIAYALLLLPVAFTNIKQNLKNPPTIFFLLFLSTTALSTIFSIDQKRSLIQLAIYVSYFVVFTSIGSIFASPKSKNLFAICYLLFAIILSLVALYNTLIVNYVNRESAGVSFMWVYFGHNHLSALLLFSIPIALYFLITKSKFRINFSLFTFHFSLFWLVASCLLLVALYFSFSRASIISLIIASLAISLVVIKKHSLKVIIAVLAFFLIVTGISYQTFVSPKQFGVKKVDLTSPSRMVYWQQAAANFLQHPLTGSGLDTFRHVSQSGSQKVLKTYYAHNFFLQMLSDAGIFGFLSSLLLIGSVLWHSAKKFAVHSSQFTVQEKLLHTTFFAGLLASTLNTLVDFDWQLPMVFLIFWLIASLQQGKTKTSI